MDELNQQILGLAIDKIADALKEFDQRIARLEKFFADMQKIHLQQQELERIDNENDSEC